MSSVLKVSNSSSKSEEFNLNNIQVLVDSEEQKWFKWAHVGKVLGLKHIDTSVEGLDKCEMPTRNDIKTIRHDTGVWSGSKDHQNKTDKFLSVFGVMYVIIKSQKDKGKAIKKHILKDIVPRGLDARIEENRGKHQQTITGRDNQIKALELRNEEHQKNILTLNKEIDDFIANRHAAHRGCFDNMLCFIKKNSKEIHSYYIIRCQYKQQEKHKRWLKLHYPNMEVADKWNDPNAIHRLNRFKREVIKKPNYYKNHFSLTEEKRELLETALDVTLFKT